MNVNTQSMSILEWLKELELYKIAMYIDDKDCLVLSGGKEKTLERVKRILMNNAGLRAAVIKQCRRENYERPEPRVKIEYPSMKQCYLSDAKLREAYSEMCKVQYGVPYAIIFQDKDYDMSIIEPLMKAGLMKRQDFGYVLTGNFLDW